MSTDGTVLVHATMYTQSRICTCTVHYSVLYLQSHMSKYYCRRPSVYRTELKYQSPDISIKIPTTLKLVF